MVVYDVQERLRRLISYAERRGHSATRAALCALDPQTCTDDELEAFRVGPYRSWRGAVTPQCEECQQEREVTVILGNGECDDCGREVHVCLLCLQAATEQLIQRLVKA